MTFLSDNDILKKCIEKNPSCNFRNCSIEELQTLYKLLSTKFETIKEKKNAQKYNRLSRQICEDPENELDVFKTIIYTDSVVELKKEIMSILDLRRN